jgi:plastocyanin
MRAIRILAVLAIAATFGLVAGCGGDDDDDDAAATEATTTEEGGGATEIAMTEYAFDPLDVTVGGGDTITATNDGQLPHNYTVIGAGGAGAVEAVISDVAPGSTGEVTLNLQPGEYEVICTIDEHSDKGMRGTLTVGGGGHEDETETEPEGGDDSGGGGSGY